jgi:hypothetical protein
MEGRGQGTDLSDPCKTPTPARGRGTVVAEDLAIFNHRKYIFLMKYVH